MPYTLVKVLFSRRVKFILLRKDQWYEKIERMYSDENVLQFSISYVCRAATEGTSVGVSFLLGAYRDHLWKIKST